MNTLSMDMNPGLNEIGGGVAAAAEADAAAAPRAIARAFFELHPAEVVIIDIRPPLARSLVAEATGWFAAAAFVLVVYLILPASILGWAKPLVLVPVGLMLVPLLRDLEPWSRKRYLLTDRRVLTISGHLVEVVREMPLTAVKKLELSERTGQSVVALKTLVFVPGAGEMLRWENISDAVHVRDKAREAVRKYGRALEE
ncbi:MAG TPA: hypothetical protein VG797_06940 [Phycisphaerales bacterium]|nr:hypothetical protein [Phycisphaerales bacterium]